MKLMRSHCSALIKLVVKENKIKDIMIGHSTWDDYSEMLRIYKYYEMELTGDSEVKNGLQKSQVMFSSYPGCLSSTDDWYIINSRFIVTETTLEVLQETIYKSILDIKHYIPDFMRVLQANRMATSAVSWVFWLSYYNTGTYNS